MNLLIFLMSIIIAFFLTYFLKKKLDLSYYFILLAGGFSGILTGLIVNIIDSFFKINSILVLGIIELLSVTIILVLLIRYRFYRNPDRIPPGNEDIIVSPADGKIKYIRRIEEGSIPIAIKGKKNIQINEIAGENISFGNGFIIGISMSIVDVHVNRAPISGEVIMTKHTSAEFLSLKDPDSEMRNERNTILIESKFNNRTFDIVVVQIASRLVRRIDCYVKKHDKLTIGQEIGMIKFGSQVDLIFQDINGLKILVSEGEQVYAGETLIAEFH